MFSTVTGHEINTPGWFSNVSSSSLATTILSLSALSITNMIAWPSLQENKRKMKTQESRINTFLITKEGCRRFTCSSVPKGSCICLDLTCRTL